MTKTMSATSDDTVKVNGEPDRCPKTRDGDMD